MEIKNNQKRKTKTIYSELATARESVTTAYVFADSKVGRQVGELYSGKREGFR